MHVANFGLPATKFFFFNTLKFLIQRNNYDKKQVFALNLNNINGVQESNDHENNENNFMKK